jgi:hypothetical protein
MKKYNYFYNGQSITRKEFENNVPEDWQKEVNELGEFSWGYYRAIEL